MTQREPPSFMNSSLPTRGGWIEIEKLDAMIEAFA